jgi:transposase-like protein
MSEDVKPTVVEKKKRQRRSMEMIAQLVWEAERSGNIAEICRRENIAPAQMYRWRSRLKEAGVEALKSTKRGPKGKDSEKEELRREVSRLKSALCESTIELHLLKKSVSSGYSET